MIVWIDDAFDKPREQSLVSRTLAFLVQNIGVEIKTIGNESGLSNFLIQAPRGR